MTRADLNELRRLHSAAFRAPWKYEDWQIDCGEAFASCADDENDECGYPHDTFTITAQEEYPADPDSPQVVAQLDETTGYHHVPGLEQFAKANGELIVAMRNALPALLAEAEAGRKLREAIGGHQLAIVGGLSAQSAAMHIAVAISEYDAAVGVE